MEYYLEDYLDYLNDKGWKIYSSDEDSILFKKGSTWLGVSVGYDDEEDDEFILIFIKD